MGEYIKNLTGLFHVILINKNTCRVVVQLLSCVPLFATPIDCSKPGFPILHNPLQFAQVHVYESVMLSNHLILCHPVLLLPSILPSIRVFSNESALRIRWPKYWSFSNNPSNENSGLISFRVDCYDLLAVQGTLKSLLQYSVIKMNNWDIQWRGWIGKKRGLVKEARHHLCDSICVKL